MSPEDYQAARRQLLACLADLQRVHDRLRLEAPALYEELPRSAREKFARLDREVSRLGQDELTVAFVGGFSAGKSSLINALIGNDLLPENVAVTTAVPTFLREAGSDGEEIELHWLSKEDGARLGRSLKQDLAAEIGRQDLGDGPVSALLQAAGEVAQEGRGHALLEYLKKYLESDPEHWLGERGQREARPLAALADVVTNEDTARFLDRVVVRKAGLGLPADVTLVDLPGISAPNPRHRELTFRFVTRDAHAVVLVLNATQLWPADVVEVLQKFRDGGPQTVDRAVFVINRWDNLNETNRAKTKALFRETLPQFAIPGSCRPFTTNALHGLLAALPPSEAQRHDPHWPEDLERQYRGSREAALEQSGIAEVRRHLDDLLANRLRRAVLASAATVAVRDVADPLLAPLRAEYDANKRYLEEDLDDDQRQQVRELAQAMVEDRVIKISAAIAEARNVIINQKAALFRQRIDALREELTLEIQQGVTTDAHHAYQAILLDGYLRKYPYYFEIEIRVVDDLNQLLKQRFVSIVRDQIRIPVNELLKKLNGVIKEVRGIAGAGSKVGEELQQQMDDFDRTFDASIEGAVKMKAAALDKLLVYHPPRNVLQKVGRYQNPLLDQLAEAAHELADKFLSDESLDEADFARKTALIRAALQSRYVAAAVAFEHSIIAAAPPMVGHDLGELRKRLEEILRRRFADVAETLAESEVRQEFADRRAGAEGESKRLVSFIERLERIKQIATLCREGRPAAAALEPVGSGDSPSTELVTGNGATRTAESAPASNGRSQTAASQAVPATGSDPAAAASGNGQLGHRSARHHPPIA